VSEFPILFLLLFHKSHVNGMNLKYIFKQNGSRDDDEQEERDE
jgi:hypothetical protein